MVTIVDFKRSTNSAGQSYFSLKLQGDIELIQSSSGSFYATAKTAFLSSTLDEEACKLMIGKSIPGSIVKQSCDPYDYTIKATGEVIQLKHRFRFKEEIPISNPKPGSMRSKDLNM